ncbi:MAG TPA: formyltransferase family protein [Gemmatimonadaceae bacterium]|nr:formyltransferase family protein [Gemmatimonadaceae bacterium]
MAWIADRKPDVIFCFGWSRLLKQRLLQLAPLGVVGFHPTLLPSNRGRHPLIWALALGLTESGSTFFFMGEGADDGDILSQDRVRIDQSDDAGFLYEKITRCALGQIDAFVPQLASGSFTRVPQDHQRANSWRKREKADGRIDWRMGSLTIHNLVRALARPYPGAHFIHQGREVTVWKTEVVGGVESNIEPGRVIGVEATGPTVKCGERAIKLIETEPAFVPSIGEYL